MIEISLDDRIARIFEEDIKVPATSKPEREGLKKGFTYDQGMKPVPQEFKRKTSDNDLETIHEAKEVKQKGTSKHLFLARIGRKRYSEETERLTRG